jgi:hypothetical protein
MSNKFSVSLTYSYACLSSMILKQICLTSISRNLLSEISEYKETQIPNMLYSWTHLQIMHKVHSHRTVPYDPYGSMVYDVHIQLSPGFAYWFHAGALEYDFAEVIYGTIFHTPYFKIIDQYLEANSMSVNTNYALHIQILWRTPNRKIHGNKILFSCSWPKI